MAKHLSKENIKAIVNMIRGWDNSKLTWVEICENAKPLIGKLPTRQSLNSHKEITIAYQTKRDSLKIKAPSKSRPASLNAAAMRIDNLEAELAEVKEQNRRYKEMFVTWQYNAYKHGVKEKQLKHELPKINRGRTDDEKR